MFETHKGKQWQWKVKLSLQDTFLIAGGSTWPHTPSSSDLTLRNMPGKLFCHEILGHSFTVFLHSPQVFGICLKKWLAFVFKSWTLCWKFDASGWVKGSPLLNFHWVMGHSVCFICFLNLHPIYLVNKPLLCVWFSFFLLRTKCELCKGWASVKSKSIEALDGKRKTRQEGR